MGEFGNQYTCSNDSPALSAYNFPMSDATTPHGNKARILSMAEAAEMFGFSPQFLSELAKRGRLKAFRVGRSWATTIGDMEAYIRSRQKKGAFRQDISLDD